ncbi:hypothetical protein [Streptomyces sp. DH37]|uniref:hypothetical protein n=1 Tax=Streptomyces sp. DH37 TaxID=3040122 RepID=UPI002442C49D|nr:hypothetical protein [Streptomyces sp. DH37]MDG9701036.1 hypothetical protein [Streptomyces sp. DH37]
MEPIRQDPDPSAHLAACEAVDHRHPLAAALVTALAVALMAALMAALTAETASRPREADRRAHGR